MSRIGGGVGERGLNSKVDDDVDGNDGRSGGGDGCGDDGHDVDNLLFAPSSLTPPPQLQPPIDGHRHMLLQS